MLRSPDFAPSSETPDFASSFRLREATSGKPGGYVVQDFDELSRVAILEFISRAVMGSEFGGQLDFSLASHSPAQHKQNRRHGREGLDALEADCPQPLFNFSCPPGVTTTAHDSQLS